MATTPSRLPPLPTPYQGITDIRSSRTLALIGNGSISGSTNISLAAGAILDVSGRPDQTLTLAAGQTLQGSGTINGKLSVGGGAAVVPGGAGTLGTLTVTNAVVLSGTTLMDLDQTNGTSDQITGAGITYGGTLSLNNLAGTLAGGNSFTLFNASSYSGSFANITPATPGPGLAWDTSQLNTAGILRVLSSSRPLIGKTTASGGNLIFSGTGGVANGSYALLTTTNITTPAANWTSVITNSFGNTGAFSVTNAIITGTPQKFYRIKELP